MFANRLSTHGFGLRPVAVVVAVATVLAGCSHGSKASAPKAPGPPSSTQSGSASRTTHALRIGSEKVERSGTNGSITNGTRRAVLRAAQRYVDNAILAPLETGKLGRDYAGTFVSSVRPAATGVDQGILTDLVIGRTTSLSEDASPVTLSALFDPAGNLLYTATRFTLTVRATRANGAVTIKRTVELTLESDGKQWLVDAYRISVKRTVPKPPTTTTKPRRARPHATTSTVRPRTKPKPTTKTTVKPK